MPTVSVIMAVYNGERFIREAIDSVLDEDHCDLELVVLDDGSTDATPRILADYVSRDDRIVVHREKGENLAQALNRACRLSRGRLLARIDADDVSLPGRLAAQVNFMDAHPDVVLLGGQALLVNDSGEEFGTATYPLRDVDLRERLLATSPFVHSAIMMRRDAFEAVGGYRDNLPHAEDLDLWLRLSERGDVANLPDAVVKYRIHGEQQSFRQQEEQAVHAAATRASARARAEGKPDPLDGAADEEIDAALLVAHGVGESEITQAIVESATWLGKTTGRAGYPEAATLLFDAAYEKARSASGSRELTASVHRSVGLRHAEQGHKVRANWKFAQARLAEWR
ncbi:MAG TPA: glycosyltransferase [Solirubrobacterales bacterium]|jgi:GT2 family glycosyltransferase